MLLRINQRLEAALRRRLLALRFLSLDAALGATPATKLRPSRRRAMCVGHLTEPPLVLLRAGLL